MNSSQYAFRPFAYRIGNGVNSGLLILTFILAAIHSNWVAALLIGIPALIMPWLLYRMSGDTLLARISFGISFMAFTALHIHLSMGTIELHFGIFVLLAILIAFRDWVVILCAAAFIAVHHILFMLLQNSGAGVYVTEDTATLGVIALHAAYVVVEAIVLMIICRASLREAQVSQALYNVAQAMVRDDNHIVLTERCPPVRARVINQFNQVLEHLQQTMQMIQRVTTQVRDEGRSLDSHSTSLTLQTQTKLEEVGHIAVATEQLSQGIEEIAQMAQQALSASTESSQIAHAGQDALNGTCEDMQQLSETLHNAEKQVAYMADSVNTIQSVIEVISSVAEKTNLLALNAAIEAARAGDHGRGFAVVADEVRNLANQTRQSTEQVNEMIRQLTAAKDKSVEAVTLSREQSDTSVQMMIESRQLIEKITTQTSMVQDAMHTINRAIDEQTRTSQQISTSTHELNELEKHQATISQELASSAKLVDNVAQQLNQQVARFVLN